MRGFLFRVLSLILVAFLLVTFVICKHLPCLVLFRFFILWALLAFLVFFCVLPRLVFLCLGYFTVISICVLFLVLLPIITFTCSLFPTFLSSCLDFPQCDLI